MRAKDSVILSAHCALLVRAEQKRLSVEQVQPGRERMAINNMATAADMIRTGHDAIIVAAPGYLARLYAYLLNSGHITA